MSINPEYRYVREVFSKFDQLKFPDQKNNQNSLEPELLKQVLSDKPDIIVDRIANYYIQNTIPLIEKYMPNTLIVIIEQDEGKLFNRGCILNIGFKEYQDQTKYFITQDIDINPKKDCLTKYYNKEINNIICGILISPCITLGGIVKISSDNIFKLNGFPNNIWGWGSEDKALENRRVFFKTDEFHTWFNTYKVQQKN